MSRILVVSSHPNPTIKDKSAKISPRVSQSVFEKAFAAKPVCTVKNLDPVATCELMFRLLHAPKI